MPWWLPRSRWPQIAGNSGVTAGSGYTSASVSSNDSSQGSMRMVKKQRKSNPVRLSAEQIARLDVALARVSAAAISIEAKAHYGMTLGRAECRRVAAQIKESRAVAKRDLRDIRLRIGRREIELLREISTRFGKIPSDIVILLIHRAASELVGGGPVLMQTERLREPVIDAYLQMLGRSQEEGLA